MALFGPDKLPPAVKALIPRGERVLAWATDVRGDYVLATLQAAYVPVRDGEHERVPFESIASATWDDPVLEMHLVGGRRRLIATLDDAGELPPTVRERVTATIALSEHVDLVGTAGARITARRHPGGSEVHWNVVFDAGLDPRDPDLRARADAAIERLKIATGL